ncbi:MAG: phage tail protein [Gammaproteobacteria bacterium]|nr:phage tail protein [Gammaproteobacteria bacterium]MBU1647423.1 phage tail protein [Gammaproteobacteria bacterium]MBU1973215.1 phage tail protein [Gammaproteobacteria bacterium]
MATATKWSNIGIAVQSALAAADTITAITKANPGVATSVAHGMSDGDIVVLTVQGMHQLDGRVARVANKTLDTFELEGIDTTLFDTFTSGTSEVITFGTALSTATNVSASGGDFDFIDVTTIHDNVKKQIPGLANPATFSFENIWDVSDAGLVALKSASDSQAKRACRFTFANGQKLYFTGYIGASLLPTGSAQEVVKTSVVITMFGKPTVYAS